MLQNAPNELEPVQKLRDMHSDFIECTSSPVHNAISDNITHETTENCNPSPKTPIGSRRCRRNHAWLDHLQARSLKTTGLSCLLFYKAENRKQGSELKHWRATRRSVWTGARTATLSTWPVDTTSNRSWLQTSDLPTTFVRQSF